jgi:hypothetical protein
MMNAATGRGLHRLRDDRKLVLGVHAAGWTAHSGGLNYWVASASFAEVPKVLTEIDSMMRALGTDGPTPDELETVREAFAADFVQDVKTTAEAARSYAGRIMKGLPPEQVTAEINQVDAVTGDAIRAAAAKYLDPSRGRILVAGDLRQLRDPLLSLGWGPVEASNGEARGADRRGRCWRRCDAACPTASLRVNLSDAALSSAPGRAGHHAHVVQQQEEHTG